MPYQKPMAILLTWNLRGPKLFNLEDILCIDLTGKWLCSPNFPKRCECLVCRAFKHLQLHRMKVSLTLKCMIKPLATLTTFKCTEEPARSVRSILYLLCKATCLKNFLGMLELSTEIVSIPSPWIARDIIVGLQSVSFLENINSYFLNQS